MKVLVFTNNLSGLFSFRKEVMKAIVDKGCQVNISAPSKDNSYKTGVENFSMDAYKKKLYNFLKGIES